MIEGPASSAPKFMPADRGINENWSPYIQPKYDIKIIITSEEIETSKSISYVVSSMMRTMLQGNIDYNDNKIKVIRVGNLEDEKERYNGNNIEVVEISISSDIKTPLSRIYSIISKITEFITDCCSSNESSNICVEIQMNADAFISLFKTLG